VRSEIVKSIVITGNFIGKDSAEQIRAGQVLGMPTDTFYGLAADPF